MQMKNARLRALVKLAVLPHTFCYLSVVCELVCVMGAMAYGGAPADRSSGPLRKTHTYLQMENCRDTQRLGFDSYYHS